MRFPWQRRRVPLSDRVARALERGGLTIDELSVSAHRGRVTLRGAVADAVVRERARALVRAVDGVTDVDDRLAVVAPVEPQVPPPHGEALTPVYVAQPGDTLPAIAERELGRRARWRELLELNPQVVSDPGVLQPGLKLRLPKR